MMLTFRRTVLLSSVSLLLVLDLLVIGSLPDWLIRPLCFPVKWYIELSGVGHLGITQLIICFLSQWLVYSIALYGLSKVWYKFTHNKALKQDK